MKEYMKRRASTAVSAGESTIRMKKKKRGSQKIKRGVIKGIEGKLA